MPAAPLSPLLTSVRLPAHRLELDEAEFLRLLCCSFSLHIIEKRALIRSLPKLRQDQLDELLRIFGEEEAEQESRNAADPDRRQGYAQAIGRQREKWQAMEQKIEAGDWP